MIDFIGGGLLFVAIGFLLCTAILVASLGTYQEIKEAGVMAHNEGSAVVDTLSNGETIVTWMNND